MICCSAATGTAESIANSALPEFVAVTRNRFVRVQGKHPYRLVTLWRDPLSKRVFTFRSGDLWTDPTPHVANRAITVHVDPRNPRYRLPIALWKGLPLALTKAVGPRLIAGLI